MDLHLPLQEANATQAPAQAHNEGDEIAFPACALCPGKQKEPSVGLTSSTYAARMVLLVMGHRPFFWLAMLMQWPLPGEAFLNGHQPQADFTSAGKQERMGQRAEGGAMQTSAFRIRERETE